MADKTSPPNQARTDLVAYCAWCNFEEFEKLYPENLPKQLLEKLRHAVLVGTVQTLFATDPAQRLTRRQLSDLLQTVDGEAGHVLFERCWHALEIPEPDKPFIDGVDQWEQIEKTKRFLEQALENERSWAEYARYVQSVVDTDWYDILHRGTEAEKEWCIRVHVKFLSPVQDSQLLGALHLTAAKLANQSSATTETWTQLIHGRAPQDFRRQFAETFVTELGLLDDSAQADKHRNEAVDYFDRAFGIGAFWEGERPTAIASNFPGTVTAPD